MISPSLLQGHSSGQQCHRLLLKYLVRTNHCDCSFFGKAWGYDCCLQRRNDAHFRAFSDMVGFVYCDRTSWLVTQKNNLPSSGNLSIPNYRLNESIDSPLSVVIGLILLILNQRLLQKFKAGFGFVRERPIAAERVFIEIAKSCVWLSRWDGLTLH